MFFVNHNSKMLSQTEKHVNIYLHTKMTSSNARTHLRAIKLSDKTQTLQTRVNVSDNCRTSKKKDESFNMCIDLSLLAT